MQHYVPQAYLKRFANTKGRTYVYDTEKNEVRQTNIRQICCEKDFYTLAPWDKVVDIFKEMDLESEGISSLEEMKKAWEDGFYFESYYLAPFDEFSNDTINDVIKYLDDKNHLPMNKLEDLHRVVVMQNLRTKKNRVQMANYADAFIKTFAKIKGEDFDSIELSYSNDYLKHQQIGQMQNDEVLNKHMEHLAGCFVTVCRNNSNWGFFCNDHPLVIHANDKSLYGGVHLTSYGAEMYFPLSEKYCLSFLDMRYIMNELNGNLELLKEMNGMVINGSYQNILRINHLLVQGAHRYVISKYSQFEIIRKIEQERPEDLLSNSGVMVGGFTSGTIYNNARVNRKK
jgi:hypothetical protein